MIRVDRLSFVATLTLVATASVSIAGVVSAEAETSMHLAAAGTYTVTVPPGVTSIHVKLDGAQGGGGSNGVSDQPGGKGGRVEGTLAVKAGDTFQINLGGSGTSGLSGGGSNGGAGSSAWGGGGGGASDIRVSPFGVDNRIFVAGGGGGAGSHTISRKENSLIGGGYGGGKQGGKGEGFIVQSCSPQDTAGGGGTDVAGGKGGATDCWSTTWDGGFGFGGKGGFWSGGGGGGYYGGGGGVAICSGLALCIGAGGGGGSGHVSQDVTGAHIDSGVHTGDGEVTISFIEE